LQAQQAPQLLVYPLGSQSPAGDPAVPDEDGRAASGEAIEGRAPIAEKAVEGVPAPDHADDEQRLDEGHLAVNRLVDHLPEDQRDHEIEGRRVPDGALAEQPDDDEEEEAHCNDAISLPMTSRGARPIEGLRDLEGVRKSTDGPLVIPR